MDEAIGYCIGNGILRDFLLRQRAEVMKMSIYEYDEERELALIRRDEREIGMEQGIERGKEIGEKIGRQEEKENNIKSVVQTVDKVLRETYVSRSLFLSAYEICAKKGGFSLGETVSSFV